MSGIAPTTLARQRGPVFRRPKCDLKRIPDLETAIREGIDSGEAVGFDPEDHLQTLKAKRANG